ncbi:hypothetical protein CYY_005515 [Polysphondylium violaceum]|uniref:ABC transporter domain-containing protein n=1 Tax=Polysphondylium violaceum TaxID=133409 RepID=A0A8J4PTD4_9MYCE|nr:hypothetical protein CYY_005515 [Polysphondylium violaceum]
MTILNEKSNFNDDSTRLSWTKTQSFEVELRNLTVSCEIKSGLVPLPWVKGEKKEILKQIDSLRVPAGSFLAILGTSGSGKTTLLNTISGRSEELIVEGDILFNGHKVFPEEIRKSVGYVLQSDQLLPTLTVRETLQYAGLLRLPNTFTKARKMEIVEEIIGELALRDCANRQIGNSAGKRGISGGELRRVSIGVQMLSNPGVLYLDEPSSGLDSFTAHNLVETLLSLSRLNKTVICTIHQPRADIFKLFDYVLLLSKGNVVYYGPTTGIVDHFAALGYECPYDVNPADFFLDLITINSQNEKVEQESTERLGQLIEGYKESLLSKPSIGLASSSAEEMKRFVPESRNTSFLYQVLLLIKRSFQHIIRDKSLFMARLVETILMALITGGIFYNLEQDIGGIKSRIAAFYIVVILQPYLIIIATILHYSEELRVFDREHYDGMYSSVAYWCASKASNLPFEIITSFIFSSIFYWMANLRPTLVAFLWFYLVLTLVQYASASMGHMSSSIIRGFAGASLMANLTMTFIGISSGYLINPATFPFYLDWISYVSMYAYAFSALSANEFLGNNYPCPYPPDDIQCALYQGDQILSRLELRSNDIGFNCIILLVIATFFNTVSFLALRFIKYKPK